MTIKQYIKEKNSLQAPVELDSFDRAKWYTVKIQELKDKLSDNDLKTVLKEEENWERKVQSSII